MTAQNQGRGTADAECAPDLPATEGDTHRAVVVRREVEHLPDGRRITYYSADPR